jgi:predicted NBD/HSP70 family sugar kinase
MSDLVFICHASENADIANMICSKLEKQKIKCWIAPRDTEAGNFMGSLVKAIKSSSIVVLVFSEHANHSPYVMRELQKAVDLNKTIIPLIISEVKPSEEMDFAIGSQHWIDGFVEGIEKGIDVLVSKVREKISVNEETDETKLVKYLGIDFEDEGLNIVTILTDGNVITRNKKFPPDKRTSEKEIVNEIIDVIDDLACSFDDEKKMGDVNQIEEISVMVPGAIKDNEKVHFITRVKSENNIAAGMQNILRNKLKYNGKLSFFNDANAAAISEYYFRNAEHDALCWTKSLVYIYWGGGIGAGIVVGGKPIYGNNGYAGEFGHLIVSEYGPICSCGNTGCLESYLSESALSQLITNYFEKATKLFRRKEIDANYEPQNPYLINPDDSTYKVDVEAFLQKAHITTDVNLKWQNDVIEKMVHILGIALANLVNCLDPEVIIFGSKLGRAINPDLIALVDESIQKNTFVRGYMLENANYAKNAAAFGGYLANNEIEENDALRIAIMNQVKL